MKMKLSVSTVLAAVTLSASIATSGCAQTATISGSVDDVVENAQSLATDEEFDVEVTGYIVEPNPATSVIGSENSHSSLQIYASDDPSGNYVLALFSDSADKLNETISEANQPSIIKRVTIEGDGLKVGPDYVNIENCSMSFD